MSSSRSSNRIFSTTSTLPRPTCHALPLQCQPPLLSTARAGPGPFTPRSVSPAQRGASRPSPQAARRSPLRRASDPRPAGPSGRPCGPDSRPEVTRAEFVGAFTRGNVALSRSRHPRPHNGEGDRPGGISPHDPSPGPHSPSTLIHKHCLGRRSSIPPRSSRTFFTIAACLSHHPQSKYLSNNSSV